MVTIRNMESQDLRSVLYIMNHYIQTSEFVYTDTPKSFQELKTLFAELQRDNMPSLVAVEDNSIVGYVYVRPYGEMKLFKKHTLTNSIYLDPTCTGKGIGAMLLKALIENVKRDLPAVLSIIACIDSENIASIRVHERTGFVQSGHVLNVAEKFKHRRAMLFLQRLIL